MSLKSTSGHDWLNQARALRRERRLAEARQAYRRAVEANPEDASVLGELGVVEHQLGDRAAAAALLLRALAIDPSNAELLLARGAMLHADGDPAGAAAVLRDAVAGEPTLVAAWHRLGSCLIDLKQHQEAAAALRRAIELAPQRDAAHNNLGVRLEALGQCDEALDSYQRAAELNPRNAKAHRNVGKLLAQRGELLAAKAAHERALALAPGYAMALSDLGTCHERLGEEDAALARYRRAAELDQHSAVIQNNLGNLHYQRGEAQPALEHLQRAIALDPELAEAHGNLAAALAKMGELEAAHASHRRAFAIDGDSPGALAAYALSCQKVCDWESFQALLPRLEALARGEVAGDAIRPSVSPFAALALPWPAELQSALARLASRRIAASMRATAEALDLPFDRPARIADPDRPLRIGYLSSDLRNHAIGHLMAPVFGAHDRDRVSVFVYSQGEDDGSTYRNRIERESDLFRDQRGQSHAQIARQIHADEVDILVDLHGYTDQHRLEVCALRPAPIMTTYLGFPGAVGAEFIDYAIADAIITPPPEEALYTEGLMLLPDTYQASGDRQRVIDRTPVTRAECGLPELGVVLCCFNGSHKLEPVMFARWMEILRAVPDSVLWLWVDASVVRRNLQATAKTAGVAIERLIFAELWPTPRHLSRLSLADLFLDTRIYNAHTSASDALWAGVPVLTCPGETFAGRVGASVLTAAGLPELIVPDLDAYVATAVRLARDPAQRAALREKLAAGRQRCALFDTPRFVRNLERAYRLMWANYVAGGPIPRVTRVIASSGDA